MKILHFITSLRTGGAERLVVDLIPRLRAMGDDVDLLVMDGTECIFSQEAHHRGITVHSLGKGAKAMHNPLLAISLYRFIKTGNYDVVHTHNTPCQLLTAAVAPRSTVLVTTEHNTDNRRRKNHLWRPIDKLMYGRYRSIIACGEDTAESLSAYLPELSSKISVITNGIDLSSFSEAAPATDLSSRFAEKKVIAMVAAFRPQKDHATILQALSLLPEEYVLALVGTGDTMDKYQERARALGLAERVIFTGARADVAQIYAAADIAVLSSHYEGFGLSAVEAMASGRPLVASDVPGLRNTVCPGAILFPAGDSIALAETIMRLCEDRELWQSTADACRMRAGQFDIDTTAKRYKDIYNSL